MVNVSERCTGYFGFIVVRCDGFSCDGFGYDVGQGGALFRFCVCVDGL